MKSLVLTEVVTALVGQTEGQSTQGDQEHLLQGHPETKELWREGGRHSPDSYRRHLQVRL